MDVVFSKLHASRKIRKARASSTATRVAGVRAAGSPQLEELLDDLGAVVWEADQPTGRLTYVSSQIASLLGLPADHVLNSPTALADLIHPDDRQEVDAPLSELRLPTDRTYRFVRPDGRVLWVRETIRLATNESTGEPIVRGTIVDITSVKDAEEIRRALEEQLRQAQKMEAVGRLAGGVAHDFNNLLTAILGYSELVLDELTDRQELKSDIEEIVRAGRSAAALTRQLLAFSRKQVMQPITLSLNEAVAHMDKLLRRLIGEDVELVTVLDENLALAKADPALLEQVIINLAVNARDAMPRGGRLTIETQNVELDEGYVRAHVELPQGRYAMVAVSDTGCGMDKSTLARVFEPFFTTKEAGKGTGLGLSTVYGIVKQSSGYIWAYSEPDIGTTFKVYLPAVDDAIEIISPDFASTLTAAGTETILIVEDEETVRDVAGEGLRRSGYNVFVARTGEEAVQLLDQYKGELHLLLTDVVLPGMSGPAVVKRARDARPNLAVLYMSGYTDNAVVHHQILEPGTAFLQKPFTPQMLNRKVREVLNT
ncbi:MAG: response regulator [Acidobacteria bacterium]|nr:response regulator [Acidobacteriota bacterium]